MRIDYVLLDNGFEGVFVDGQRLMIATDMPFGTTPAWDVADRLAVYTDSALVEHENVPTPEGDPDGDAFWQSVVEALHIV